MQGGKSGSGGTAAKSPYGDGVTVAMLARAHAPFLEKIQRRLLARAPVWYPEIRALHAICRALILASNASKAPSRTEHMAHAVLVAEEATLAAQLAKESRE